MEFKDRLKVLRQEHHLTQTQFAERSGIGRSVVAMYETGKRKPSFEALETIADFFNVSMDYLTGKSDLITKFELPHIIKETYRIPVLGKVAAGTPIDACEDIIGYEYLTDKYRNDGCEYFALRIQGRSMEPTIMDGDNVIVRQQSTVDSGDIAIVLINGDSATAKEVRETDDGITLIGHNIAVYSPHPYSWKDIKELPVTIIGKVIEIRRTVG